MRRSAARRASSSTRPAPTPSIVETTGEIGELRGDCPNADDDYEYRGDDLPDVDIVLVDDNGDEIDLDDDESKDYDAAGFVGRSVASVEIPEAGDYEITATSDEDQVAVAVGRNPKDTAGSMKTMGIGALALGVLIGGLCLVLGMRRKPAASGARRCSRRGTPPAPVSYGRPARRSRTDRRPFGGAPGSGQVPVTPPPYQPPAYQPPPPPAPPAPPAPTVPMPATPPADDAAGSTGAAGRRAELAGTADRLIGALTRRCAVRGRRIVRERRCAGVACGRFDPLGLRGGASR